MAITAARENPQFQDTNFQRIISNFCDTAYKIVYFIKNNFFNIVAICSIVAGGFLFSSYVVAFEISMAFVVLKVINKIFNHFFYPLEKINTAPFAKKYITNFHDSRAWLKVFEKKDFHGRKNMLKEIGLQTLRSLGVSGVLDIPLNELDNTKKNT